MYGKEFLSSEVGRRLGPITSSISMWAFFCTSGYIAIAKKKACIVDTVWNNGIGQDSQIDGVDPQCLHHL